MCIMDTSGEEEIVEHCLSDKWVLWAHLPHDTDWSIKSYKKIMEVSTVSEMVSLYNALPEKLVKNCMLFLMRKNISPTWEDPKNRGGGCFSYKVLNKSVHTVWRHMSFLLVGDTITRCNDLIKCINGITISPKKSFCIVKIWISNCNHQNPAKMISVDGLNSHGCLFKKHKPEY